MILSDKKIILASNSPRRQQLLSEAGFEFIVKTMPDVEESYPEEMDVIEVPEFLAIKKAEASKSFLMECDLIITADTLVIQDGKIFGKPKDREDAIEILKTLEGRKHNVITGVCILTKTEKKSFSSEATVYFASIGEDEITYYVDKFEPFDKAGAYAIQEWIGHCKIEKIDGTYPNIMGLPMNDVYKTLRSLNFDDISNTSS